MELLKLIEGMRTPFLDVLVGMITRFGEQGVAIVLFCVIFWCLNKRVAYGMGIAFFLSGLTVQGMKICFRIERPWVIDPTFNPVPGALEYATGYSFPSGHTQTAAAVFGSLGVYIRQAPIKVACFLIVFLVAYSRLYLGVHTLPDVAVSILITFLLILLAVKIAVDPVNKKREGLTALAMVLYAAIWMVVGSVMFSRGIIEQTYLSDCLKAAGATIGYAIGMYIERIYISFSIRSKNILINIIKCIVGFIGVLLIMQGLKLIIGTGLVVDTIRYFFLLMWITAIYPMIIKRLFAKS